MRKLLTTLACLCVLAALNVHSASAQRTPPRNYEDRGACPFECCTYREWSVKADTILYKSRAKNAHAVVRLKKGERVTGLTGVVVTLEPGRAVANADMSVGDGSRKVSVRAGDVLHLMHYQGEGFYKIWFRGRFYDDAVDFVPASRQSPEDAGRSYLRMLSGPKTVWWMKVRNRRGQVGWTKQNGHFGDVDACG